MPRVIVRLRQRHTVGAKRQSSCHCPLAQAINDVLPYGIRVAVAKDHLTVLGIGPPPRPSNVRVELPPEVAAVLSAYDGGGRMMLMTFPLEFPDL